MKLLPTEFEKPIQGSGGYRVHYHQVSREGQVAVFQRTAPEWEDFETVIIQQNEAGEAEIAGDKVEFQAKETYPPSTAWGTRGFTYNTFDAAHDKMRELVTEAKQKAAEATATK